MGRILLGTPDQLDRGTLVGRTALERRSVHIRRCTADPEYTTKPHASADSASMLGVPLLRDGVPIGVIGLAAHRVEPFTEKQIELVTTFADQAVIAIENVRLFNECAADRRTHRIAGAADRDGEGPRGHQPLGVRSAGGVRDRGRKFGQAVRRRPRVHLPFRRRAAADGGRLQLPRNSWSGWRENPIRPGRHSASARAALERRTIHIPDVSADPEYVRRQGRQPIRTVLGVPILKGDDLLGVIMIYRLEVRPFTDKQIALVETFADQAAIAIENVRLFEQYETERRR